MAKIKVKGVIKYKMKKNHPDLECVEPENRGDEFEFCDVYTIDTDCFFGRDHIESWIKHDLRLVAGGGYDTDTIKNVKIVLTWGVA